MALRHHDLCFGCGPANLFGLQLEVERRDDGSVAGRFFVKQDHQGPPGHAHGGIVGAALDDAMALASGEGHESAFTARLEVDLRAPAPVGSFLLLEASVKAASERRLEGRATARREDGTLVAEARGVLVRPAG
ncbi:MAG: PaaI family thioesterase [Actinomycetota bacterium]|nr:PaaI family thioesterase [Actinomycetota bacterium]